MQSFSKQLRLKTSGDFQALLKQRNKVVTDCFIMVVSQNHLSYPRLGIIVSRRCSKHAVIRNKLKRMVREYFRLHQHSWHGFDMVIIGRRKVCEKTTAEIWLCLERMFAKAQAYGKS